MRQSVPKERSIVALIDALGFKNIWRRYPYQDVSKALTTVRRTMADIRNWAEVQAPLGISLRLGWFSDAMYLVAHPQPKTPDRSWSQTTHDLRLCLSLVAMCIGYALREAAIQPVPTTYRGVISVGQAYVGDDNIFLGPAVSEAAALYENARGAFVWLSASAKRLGVSALDDQFSARPLVQYSVPMKKGRAVRTWVVNPFTHVLPQSDLGLSIQSGIKRAMSSRSADVPRKRRNTMRFVKWVVETEPEPVHLLSR